MHTNFHQMRYGNTADDMWPSVKLLGISSLRWSPQSRSHNAKETLSLSSSLSFSWPSPQSRSHNGWQSAWESGGSRPPLWSWVSLETLGSRRSPKHSLLPNREDTTWQNIFPWQCLSFFNILQVSDLIKTAKKKKNPELKVHTMHTYYTMLEQNSWMHWGMLCVPEGNKRGK